MVAKNIRGTRAYRQAVANLKAEGDTNCWSCGKQLYAAAQWPHPRMITLGHYTAIEDGGAPYARENHGAQCIKCNMGDGARRTNRKKSGATHLERQSYRNDRY